MNRQLGPAVAGSALQPSDPYCWAATDVGLARSINEDSYGTSGQTEARPGANWEGSLGADGWAIVADGMGGHAAGEVASELAVKCLTAMLPKLSSPEKIAAAVEATNRALYDAMDSRPALTGMGTTIAGVRFLGNSSDRLQCRGQPCLCREGRPVDEDQRRPCDPR